MAKHGALLFSYFFTTVILTMSFYMSKAIDEDRKVHIVYLGSLPDNKVYSPLSHHLGMLERVVDSKSYSAANFLTRSYKRSFSGFAANITDRERERLANMKEVVSVFPSTTFRPQTTRSWDFIGLDEKIQRNASIESDTIIGVIDSGIWPESESFRDDGFGPPPKKWKGACAGGKNFTCNKKIIGARFYGSSSESARDEGGHGTHTASTAAGNAVKDVSFYGLAQAAASTTDRRIIDKVALGNGTTLVGASVNSFTLNGTSFPLIYGKDASSLCSESSARKCVDGCLDSDLVKGKIVLCDMAFGVDESYRSGALGSIFRVDWDDDSQIFALPATTLNNKSMM
ncbi:hypothetical protein M0R45_036689 [Rubus argutus]|uniref:Cucumisin n=1 Tax=Rubus argutus TaxID=59490 RepID=A0AAW1VWZ1_RUBAR